MPLSSSEESIPTWPMRLTSPTSAMRNSGKPLYPTVLLKRTTEATEVSLCSANLEIFIRET